MKSFANIHPSQFIKEEIESREVNEYDFIEIMQNISRDKPCKRWIKTLSRIFGQSEIYWENIYRRYNEYDKAKGNIKYTDETCIKSYKLRNAGWTVKNIMIEIGSKTLQQTVILIDKGRYLLEKKEREKRGIIDESIKKQLNKKLKTLFEEEAKA